MLDELLGSVAIAAILIGAGLVAGVADRRNFDFKWLLVAAALFLVNDVALTRGLWLIPAVPGLDETWNWSGKFLALAVTLAIAALPIFGWRRIGLTWKQEQLRGALLVFAALVAVYSTMAWFMGEGGGNREAILYQLTMPGLEEEIFFRGLFLVALNRAFAGHVRIGGAAIGWALPLNALVFGLVHGLGVQQGVWSFDAMSFALPFLGAIPAVWLREKTGSLVLPIILHNFVNTAFVLLPL
ncbi:CPBP family intramembrane metalloprotease [Sphingomonas sinipercae]|uniref:CPBP family intramembrane metalloprotease n=1 Tax=Sphingomonas sinipercae TaxID=2714944 RepID=A0A6G7ZP56_9SPHN|nr:CPBP family glutamic-type intramembrane protease [Sphingomonas sinipercae]QIL02699.1 CPBP family intramembrane metalloprotease [Sphingomonas sinipercae]